MRVLELEEIRFASKLGFTLFLCMNACTNASTQTTPSDEPTCTYDDGGRHALCFGCAIPRAQWSSTGPLSCPRSMTDYCNQNASPVPATTAPACPPADWSTVIAQEKAYGSPAVFYECEGFNLVEPDWWCGDGTDVLFVYDASGALTSAVEFDRAGHAGQQTCLAGPASIAPLDLVTGKCKPQQCFPADSGIETGTCDLDASTD